MQKPFDTNQEYILENEAVLLRPMEESDIELLKPVALNQPELWKYSLINGGTESGLKEYISVALEARKAGKEYPFTVFDKKTNQYAGSTRFYDINIPFQTLQLGYTWYGKNFQGTGLNKNCKYLLLSFAFEMDFLRVEFRADNRNERSKAAMQSIGCTMEGVLRSNMPSPDGSRRSSAILSILKEEWDKDIKDNLYKKTHANNSI